MASATDRLSVRSLICAIVRLRRELLLPQDLRQAGVEKSAWEQMREGILEAALADPCCKTNPVTVTKDGLARILKAVEP